MRSKAKGREEQESLEDQEWTLHMEQGKPGKEEEWLWDCWKDAEIPISVEPDGWNVAQKNQSCRAK